MSIHIEEYKDFSLRLHKKGSNMPLVAQFELTHCCNLKCQHCYVANDISRQELNLSEVRRILDEIYAEGCLWLCFTGGEPLLREDFLDIYTYAYRKGFIITIFTNAILLTEKITKYLKKFPPFCIEVTLNAVTKKTYEFITQTPDSFKRAIDGINLIHKYSLPFKLKCQLMTLNIHEIDLLKDFYKAQGTQFIYDFVIYPRIDGSLIPCSFRLPAEKIAEIQGLNKEENTNHLECRKEADDFSDSLFNCAAGYGAFYINPYGELFFCNLVRKHSWDLKRNSFKEGFNTLLSKLRNTKFKTDSKCRTCRVRHLCYTCSGKADLEYGNPEAPIEYFCELAHLMAKAYSTA